MLDAAEQALMFSAGRDRGSLDADPMYRRAVMNCIQEIGEAAVNVSEDTRQKISTLAWTEITRMRNRLVHAYFEVDLKDVWEVIRNDLAPIIFVLKKILADEARVEHQ
jgi:uncharacterized protein with HEPN domain